jgi:hypothetical protein
VDVCGVRHGVCVCGGGGGDRARGKGGGGDVGSVGEVMFMKVAAQAVSHLVTRSGWYMCDVME